MSKQSIKCGRTLAFKSIYSNFYDPKQENLDEILIDEEKVDEDCVKFKDEIVKNFTEHKDELTALISKHLKGYTLSRLYKIDLAIIYLALTEIKYISTPPAIVINEAVEIAKVYSTDKSPKFINGLLADIIKQ